MRMGSGRGVECGTAIESGIGPEKTGPDGHTASIFSKPKLMTHSLTTMIVLRGQQDRIFTTQGCPGKSRIYKHHIHKGIESGKANIPYLRVQHVLASTCEASLLNHPSLFISITNTLYIFDTFRISIPKTCWKNSR